MGRYLEMLTRLFLAGAFPARAAGEAHAWAPPAAWPAEPMTEPIRSRPNLAPPVKAQPVLTRSLQAKDPPRPAETARPTTIARSQPAPVRRATRQRKFVTPTSEVALTHPGQILAQHLTDLGLTASDLARDIDVPVNRVTAIINGQRGVTADTALRLGHWFGVDPEDWLGLQLEYELALARHEIGSRVKRLPRLADRVA